MSDPIRTRVAHAEHGDNQYCGYSVLRDLAGKISTSSAIALAAGMRSITEEDARVLDDVLVCSLAADPRIWPLKVSRLLASYGGTAIAYGGAHLSLEGAKVSPWPTGECGELLVELARQLGDAPTAEAVERVVDARLEEKRIFPGFGVVFRDADERMVALEACLEQRHRTSRKYWRIMRLVEQALLRHKKLHANAGAGVAAACLDVGMTPRQAAIFATACASVCFLANAVEGAEQKPSQLRRLPDEALRYDGPGPRPSPRASQRGRTS
jgi:hypothetical protein